MRWSSMFFFFKKDSILMIIWLVIGTQITSKCGKNMKVAHETKTSGSLIFIPHLASDLHLQLNTVKKGIYLFYL